MKNDTRIQFVVSNTQPKEPGLKPGSFDVRQTTTFHFHL